jgi:trafficking protein particle complex subunit 11
MDAYPQDYVAHNYPLILLSGLRPPTEDPEVRTIVADGPLVECHLPLVTDERKELLLQEFLSLQASIFEWAAPASRSKNGLIGYRFKVVGRVR